MPPNIVAVATLIKYADAQRSETREAIAYNLLPEHKIFDWQLGYGGGGLDSGIGLIAIPSLLADLEATGVTSELAITNIVPKPGFTDFVIYVYDQNGLLDYVCQKLNEKQVEYIDLQTWGYINHGFKGSAIISAFFWEHDVFADDGRFLRNLVGLGAVAIERSKTTLGKDIPGDEAAGDRGIPFRQSDIEDEEFEFAFLGEFPSLPGPCRTIGRSRASARRRRRMATIGTRTRSVGRTRWAGRWTTSTSRAQLDPERRHVRRGVCGAAQLERDRDHALRGWRRVDGHVERVVADAVHGRELRVVDAHPGVAVLGADLGDQPGERLREPDPGLRHEQHGRGLPDDRQRVHVHRRGVGARGREVHVRVDERL